MSALDTVLARYGCNRDGRSVRDRHGRVVALEWSDAEVWSWLVRTGRHREGGRQIGDVDRCLSLHRPWDLAVVTGHKDVENRDWRSPPGEWLIGQWIGIHGGRKWDGHGADFIAERVGLRFGRDASRGGIVGAARVIGVIGPSENNSHAAIVYGDPALVANRIRSRWWMGAWGIVFDEAVALAKPIPCNGALGFWPPDEAAVEALSLAICP